MFTRPPTKLKISSKLKVEVSASPWHIPDTTFTLTHVVGSVDVRPSFQQALNDVQMPRATRCVDGSAPKLGNGNCARIDVGSGEG